jgi:hypothetical protein
LDNIRIAADITCKNFQGSVSRAGFIRTCRGLKERAGKDRDVGAACVKSVIFEILRPDNKSVKFVATQYFIQPTPAKGP